MPVFVWGTSLWGADLYGEDPIVDFVPSFLRARAPTYRVQVYANLGSPTFGIGALIAELENQKNLGWSDHLNDVPEAFFTLNQDDPKVALLTNITGRAHVRILRNDEIVWTGWFSNEYDATKEDVVFTCYGYLAGLYWLCSAWNVKYTTTSMGTIITDAWTRAKTTISNSPLNFVTTGTIQAPVTTSGGATAIVLPNYQMFYKRLLFALREMATVATSDTTNTVVFEITHSATPTFNYWKNRGVQCPEIVWRYGSDKVSDFREYTYPVYRRNTLFAVGSAPDNPSLQYSASDATDIAAWGAMQESIYFSWVRDATELARVTNLRLALAKRTQVSLTLDFYANAVVPAGAAAAGWRLSDQAKVVINRGITNIDEYYLITGVRVVFIDGDERVRALLQQPSGV